MKLTLKSLTLAVALTLCISANAQVIKRGINIPHTDEYLVLKCDFHLHSVFSDGMVWPTVRVDEAIAEGLDAIALTEHLEYRPKQADIPTQNHNRSYEITTDYAKKRDVILIKGTEVTREMTPGHFNAIFIEDANPFASFINKEEPRDGANIVETLTEGSRQNAFVFWNHPWFPHKQLLSEWASIHEELFRKGLIKGIEVVNGSLYDPKVLDWCIEKGLTVIANSDYHEPSPVEKGQHRPMTLVLAKERSQAAIREALDAGRTVAFLDNTLIGNSQHVGKIVENSLSVNVVPQTGTAVNMVEISNASSIPFTLNVESTQGCVPRINPFTKEIKIAPHSSITLLVTETNSSEPKFIRTAVKNTHIGNQKNYTYNIKL